MALLICLECGNQVSDKSSACQKCGYPTSEMIAARDAEAQEKANREKQQKEKIIHHRI